MRPEDLHVFLRATPFRPFRVTLTDGRIYDVHHPEMVMVGRSRAEIGIPDPGFRNPTFDTTVSVALIHIMQIEPLPEAGVG